MAWACGWQQVHGLQVGAQDASRAKSYWHMRPFRVRSPQTGIQVGLVAASLAELRSEAASALDIHHPWFLRLLLVEPDGFGATEVLDEPFFATVAPDFSPSFPLSLSRVLAEFARVFAW